MSEATNAQDFNPYDPEAEDHVDLVWPRGLVLPARPPPLAYLDLNHWIGLAKAAVGHPDGANYDGALQAARAVRSVGRVVFPLSGTHYQEIAKLADGRRRQHLADVMQELSDYITLASRVVVMQLELDTALDDVIGPNPDPPSQVALLGSGVGHTMGRRGGLHVVGPDGEDASDQVRRQVGAEKFNAMMSWANHELEQGILAGPQSPEMEAELRARGWQPDAARKVAEKRAQQEADQVGILDSEPAWRQGRLRDIISARELLIEMYDSLIQGIAQRNRTLEGLFSDRPSARRFVRSMPSVEVAIEMKTHFHKNRQTRWDANTIFDIDAMALAVPYCDAVVTEKHACTTLQRADFEARMGTVIMRSPGELERWLSDLT